MGIHDEIENRDFSEDRINFGALKHSVLQRRDSQKKTELTPDESYLVHVVEQFVAQHPKFSSLASFVSFLRASAEREIEDDIRQTTIQSCIALLADFAGRNIAVREPAFSSAGDEDARRDRVIVTQDLVETNLLRLLSDEPTALDAADTTPPSASDPQ